MKIGYFKKEELTKYSGITTLTSLDSDRDVATLLETYLFMKKQISNPNVYDIMVDDEGFYFFVLDDIDNNFDLFEFINKIYCDKNVIINPLNCKLLFPISKSRGICTIPDQNDNEEVSSGRTGDFEEEEIPTDYMDEDEINKAISGNPGGLFYKGNNTHIDVLEEGVIIGRSMKHAGFLISGNNNVGRVHCKVYMENGKMKVHDCDSKNGTFVNGRRVRSSQDVVLNKGDILMLATEEFEVQ